MEVSALKSQSFALRGPAPLLRLASDEQLVALIRRGQHSAFEALVGRYQSRLLAFCRHMLRSREDGEDVLQEVFAAAFNALLADEREVNVRPWLYRIARNRCLNHLRRNTAIGVDSMDVLFADGGQSTIEKVTRREDFRLLLQDISHLPETQRTAIVLREMDALSYEQIAEAMDTTVPGVKSLLVRARVSLAEAAEARKLTCDEVRLELASIAEGLSKMSSPFRRHLKECERCSAFRTQLKANNRAMALVLPIGPLLMFKKLVLAKAGFGFGGSAGGAGAGAGAAATAGAGMAGSGAAGALTAGALATKAVAGLAAAALVTAGAVEVRHAARAHHPRPAAPTRVAALPQPHLGAPAVIATHAQPLTTVHAHRRPAPRHAAAKAHPVPLSAAVPKPIAAAAPTPVKAPAAPAHPAPTTQQVSGTTVLPPEPPTTQPTSTPVPPAPVASTPAPAPTPTTTETAPPPTTTTPPTTTATTPPPSTGATGATGP